MFDQQGIWIKRQWDAFKQFLQQVKKDYAYRQTHLEVERIRLLRYLWKLQDVDKQLGGTALDGNPGASYKAGTPTECGGDLVWTNDMVLVNLLNRAADTGWDADIAEMVTTLKSRHIGQIRRKREHLEYKMKKVLDRIDQLRLQIKHLAILCAKDGGIDSLINMVEAEFSAQTQVSSFADKSLRSDEKPVGASDVRTKKEVPMVRKRDNLFLDKDAQETRDWPRTTADILEVLVAALDTNFDGDILVDKTVNSVDGMSNLSQKKSAQEAPKG